MKKNKLFTRGLALVLCLASMILPIFAEEPIPLTPTVEGTKAAFLYNLENQLCVYSLNPDEPVFPASTVKLMTAAVVFDSVEDLDANITVTEEMLKDVYGNHIGFMAGEVVTFRQMLSCMLVNSANDAAIILAHGVAGDTRAFVKMMNEKADILGMKVTHYTNPTGMHHASMVTTARETAMLCEYAYGIPGFVEMTSISKYVMEGTNLSDYRNIYNRNCMISKYYGLGYIYEDALGLNAGATREGGYALCALAEREGLTYLAVVLGAEEAEDGTLYSYTNAGGMLDWAFEAYAYQTVLTTGRVVCELPVTLSDTVDYVTLVPSKEITVFIRSDVVPSRDVTYEYVTEEASLTAPVEAGQAAGRITVKLGGEVLGECELITTSSITRSEFLYVLDRIKGFTAGKVFRGIILGVFVIAIVAVLVKAWLRERRYRGRIR